ncbi:MAG: hypothetical protein ABL895_12650 [Cyclobacteriaceae bacterium]
MPKIPLYLPFIVQPKIRIHYQDRCVEGSNGFSTIKEFVEFLNDNPEIAKALGYVPKRK